MEGNRGKTLYYALTRCGKNSFSHSHSFTQFDNKSIQEKRREKNEGKIIRRGTRIERKTEKGNCICILTSHSELLESRPTTASVQAACQWKKEKTGGDKEEVGWCEMDQTMDVRKALLFSTNCRQKRKRSGGGVGVCDNLQLLKCLCFVTSFPTTGSSESWRKCW